MKIKVNQAVSVSMYFVKTDKGTVDIVARSLSEAKHIAARYAKYSKMFLELYDASGLYIGAYDVCGGYWLKRQLGAV